MLARTMESEDIVYLHFGISFLTMKFIASCCKTLKCPKVSLHFNVLYRSTRSKLSRVERDRSTPSSPSAVNVGGLSPKEPNSPSCLVTSSANPDANAYNSEDEYETRQCSQLTEEEWAEVNKKKSDFNVSF